MAIANAVGGPGRGIALRPAMPRRGRPRALPRRRVLAGSAVAIVAGGYFVTSALQAGSVYYVTIAELQARGSAAYGQRVRVAARVLDGTIERDAGTLRFTVADDPALAAAPPAPGLLDRLFPRPAPTLPPAGATMDAAGAARLQVIYRGVVPDVFGPHADVVVEGRLTSSDVFEASTLLAKCPSKFEAEAPGAAPAGR
jgi:cytochrome c-type biogenesis protein CcmE